MILTLEPYGRVSDLSFAVQRLDFDSTQQRLKIEPMLREERSL